MGIENMRRWPMYIVFAALLLLLLSLLNSWSMETELRNKIVEISTQLQECSKQQTTCMEESLKLLEQRDNYHSKVNELDKKRLMLTNNLDEQKTKLTNCEVQLNRTSITLTDVELCKTELQSLKKVEDGKAAIMDTLKYQKDTLNNLLAEKKLKIEELEKEIASLKSTLMSQTVKKTVELSKVTPAALPPKISPSLNVHQPLNEPILENDAKEEFEDGGNQIDGDFEH